VIAVLSKRLYLAHIKFCPTSAFPCAFKNGAQSLIRRVSSKICHNFIFGLAFSLILFIFPVAGDCQTHQERKKTSEKLEEVRNKIELETGRLETLKIKQRETAQSLRLMDEELERVKKQQAEYQSTVEKQQERIKELSRKIERGAEKLKEKRSILEQRLVAIYKGYRRTTLVDYLAQSKSVNELLRRTHYISFLASRDNELLTKLGQLLATLTVEKAEIVKLNRERSANLAQLEDIGKELEQRKFSQATVLQDMERQKLEKEKSLEKLNKAAAKLEEMLSAIMGKIADEPEVAVIQPEEKPEEKKEQVGLELLRGKLPLPIKGTVVQSFGRQRHGEFSDTLFVKGIEFSAQQGSKVSSVANGRVVLQQVLPVFGKVVIVDHGNRYYTLYGRLADTAVAVGDEVTTGAAIGTVGQSDAKKRNFYFELRLKGKAIDPAPFFGF